MRNVISAVLNLLGISSFAKDIKGKSILLSVQEEQLKQRYGEQFVKQFKADLLDFEKDGAEAEEVLEVVPTAEEIAQLRKDSKALADAQVKLQKLEDEKKSFEAKIEVLGKEQASDDGAKLNDDLGVMKANKFKADMKLGINKHINAVFNGQMSSYTSDDTITTEELKQEFGRYVSSEKLEIFRSLLGTTDSLQYMSTMITDKFKVKATHAHITSVLQSFVPQWTAKGTSKFTPMTIEQFPMKINVGIIPSDIIDDVLGYLYDENLDPKDMPIVKYIIEMLVRPKLDEEREMAFAKGRHKEPEVGSDGKYVANSATDVCDGYLTILCDEKRKTNTSVNFLLKTKTALGSGNQLLADIEAAVDEVSPLYKNKTLTIHADPDLILNYARAYRDKYPNTKNQDGKKIQVDYTNFTFAGLEGMRGTGAFFITPKENFRHLMSRDPKNMTLRMTTEDYMAKIFGEWREGVGFWVAEAIFAFLPTTLVNELSPESDSTGSGSGSGTGNGL